MAYSELIKNFDRIREYMRQFYVYGFRTRTEYDQKSARSYDNERRRLESWLGDYMHFHRNESGKQVFLSVDSLSISHNPIYDAFKAKSFTDKDITLHYYVMDILSDGEPLSLNEIIDRIELDYLSHFWSAEALDSSTLRKKLKEYHSLGLIQIQKRGKEYFYFRDDTPLPLNTWKDALDFFSEESPLGVIGSYLLDRQPEEESRFRFKHHYLLHTLDCEILFQLVCAIGQKSAVRLKIRSPRNVGHDVCIVCPLKIWISSQTGRQYALCFDKETQSYGFFRLDNILKVTPMEQDADFDAYLLHLQDFTKYLWGVSVNPTAGIQHIEMTIHAESNEPYILQRLLREKRNGTVTVLDEHTYRFSADVYDPGEMIPWIRTFVGRIERLWCSDPRITERFTQDLEQMYTLYGGTAL